MTFIQLMRALAFAAVATTCAASVASAEDTLKLAVGQRGNWDTAVSEVGQRAGIFKKHGLVLDIIYTQGGGETQQAVISGSVNIGIAAGTTGVLGAFSKGAPVRIIAAETTGAGDLYWYVKADSTIKSLTDTAGKTIAFSTRGSSTDGVVNALIKQNNLTAKPTATGGPAPTLTQVLSGQVDIGWSAPPFGLKEIDEGKIRIIASGNDSLFKGQTVRVNITNIDTLQTKKALLDTYMKAYRETVAFMYNDPSALKIYAEFVGIPEATAKRTRDDFFKPPAIEPDAVVGIDQIVKDAVELKYTATELTKEQLKELIQIPPK
jgi:NitT/TauT family transport system substrate-binding protein